MFVIEGTRTAGIPCWWQAGSVEQDGCATVGVVLLLSTERPSRYGLLLCRFVGVYGARLTVVGLMAGAAAAGPAAAALLLPLLLLWAAPLRLVAV